MRRLRSVVGRQSSGRHLPPAVRAAGPAGPRPRVRLLVAAALAAAATAARAEGPGTLTLAWEAEPRTVDPRFAVDANSQYLEDLLHCPLVDFDKFGQAVPVLAKRWVWTSPTTLTVELRPEARFADGSPVTAADVAATYLFFKDDKVAKPSPRRSAFAQLKSVKAPGPATVVFELAAPDSTFVANLVVGVLPAALAAKPMLTEADAVPGCGPFKLKSIGPAGIELEANARYSLGAPPKLRGVTIKVVKDENTRYAKLAAGELDIVQNLLNRDKLGEIAKSNPKLQILRRAGLNTTYVGFNLRDKTVANPLVREAIAHAIDKAKIIKYVLSGMAVPADTLLPAGDPFHAKDLKTPAYDLAAAQALLDKAGYPAGAGGKRFSLSFKTTTDLTRVAVAKAIAAELAKVGIEVTVETLEWGRFKADVEAGRVQLWSLSWIGFKDPDIYRFAFATESFPPNGGNRGWYSNPALDKLLAAAKAETDRSLRALAYAQAEQIVATDTPYVFLWHEEVFAVVSRSVEGFEVYADGRLSSLVNAVKK